MLLGVDVGGTFTDAALLSDGRLFSAKAPSTPDSQATGVLQAVAHVLERAGRPAHAVETFAHGMTVATNALLEGRAARTALLATEGFTDLIELGRQARASLYRLCEHGPPPLTPAERRYGVPERMGPDGPLRPLDETECGPVIEELAAASPAAIAVVLLHSYADPSHERRIGELVAERLPGTHLSLSHEVVGTFREYERAATTEIDAGLSPLLSGYLRELMRRLSEHGLPAPLIMQSSGGLIDLERAARHAAVTILSGPAGGAAGAALLAARSGHPDVLCFDMGGTSCDVCVVDGGRVRETTGRVIAGRPLALPALDVHTVGAGGGSVAWRDPGGALRVGPRSAGAVPGPACYGRGGTEPTVTDANLVLGYLSGESPLAGGVALRPELAERAVGELAGALGLGTVECAEGIVRVANAEMVRALRVMTVERGIDPRSYALLPFGGAGPLHATAVAEALDIERIVCPRASGVLSALGLAAAERRGDAQRSVLRSAGELTRDTLRADVRALGEQAARILGRGHPGPASVEVEYHLRYQGQSFELPIAGSDDPDVARLIEAFAAAHEERYGYRDPEGEVELVTIRVTLREPGPELDLSIDGPAAAGKPGAAGAASLTSRRDAVFHGETRPAQVLSEPPGPGQAVDGPAIVGLPEATLVVAPGWRGATDDAGTVILERA